MKFTSSVWLSATLLLVGSQSALAQQHTHAVVSSDCEQCRNGVACEEPGCCLSRVRLYPDTGWNPPGEHACELQLGVVRPFSTSGPLWRSWWRLHRTAPQCLSADRHHATWLLLSQSADMAATAGTCSRRTEPCHVSLKNLPEQLLRRALLWRLRARCSHAFLCGPHSAADDANRFVRRPGCRSHSRDGTGTAEISASGIIQPGTPAAESGQALEEATAFREARKWPDIHRRGAAGRRRT